MKYPYGPLWITGIVYCPHCPLNTLKRSKMPVIWKTWLLGHLLFKASRLGLLLRTANRQRPPVFRRIHSHLFCSLYDSRRSSSALLNISSICIYSALQKRAASSLYHYLFIWYGCLTSGPEMRAAFPQCWSSLGDRLPAGRLVNHSPCPEAGVPVRVPLWFKVESLGKTNNSSALTDMWAVRFCDSEQAVRITGMKRNAVNPRMTHVCECPAHFKHKDFMLHLWVL